MNSDVYAQMAERIIAQQTSIIGPVAVQQAEQVPGIHVDPATHHVELSGDQASIINKLVKQYQDLFGQIAVEVCKEAAAKVTGLTPAELPKSLR
jgi:ClpP class serine protease